MDSAPPSSGQRAAGTRRFDGVLLDLFGTIISMGPAGARTRSLSEMAVALSVDPTKFARRWSDTFDARARGRLGSLEETITLIASDLGHRPTRDELQRAAQIRLDFSKDLLQSNKTVLDALDALRSAGCRLAVVSDTSEETPRLWSSTDLAPRMDATVFSCLEGVRKPQPVMYQLALQRLGIDVSRCAYVGDGGSHELSGAEKVGLATFMYRFPDADQSADDRVEADEEWSGPVLADLRELLQPDVRRIRQEVVRSD
jgi:putative hydrolase of the HAD superfamily